MSVLEEWRSNRRKKGAALKELDAFIELKRDHGNLLEDTLTGDFGRIHGDYNVANKQATACIQMVEAMMRGDTELPKLLKTAKADKRSKAEAPVVASGAEPTPA
jgi:hypothetical protein